MFGHWPENEEEEYDADEEQRRGRAKWRLSAGIVLLFIVGFVLVNTGRLGGPVGEASELPPDLVVSYPFRLRAQIEEAIGAVTPEGYARVRQIAFDGNDEAYPVVSIASEPEHDMLADAISVFHVLFSDERTELANVFFSCRTPSLFRGGRYTRVFTVVLSRETYDRYATAGLTPDRLPTIADYIYRTECE
ncbi:MAG: hypothetical protein EA426_15825 [Spirochaetaceae bacterium]|nr:MAG: hypothetical protein EA426_15825 [Spirochaetaceae bacterium]